MVRDDVKEARRGVDDAAAVHIFHDFLAGRGTQEVLRLGYNGHLERGEHALILRAREIVADRPARSRPVVADDSSWGVLERLEAGYKHVRYLEKPRPTLVVFVISTEYSACYQLADVCPGDVDGLVMRLVTDLLGKELDSVDQEAVHHGHVIRVV